MSGDEPYLWQHLVDHLREAGRDGGPEAAELEAMLRDHRWLAAVQFADDTVLSGHAARVRSVAISPDACGTPATDRTWRRRMATPVPRARLSSDDRAHMRTNVRFPSPGIRTCRPMCGTH